MKKSILLVFIFILFALISCSGNDNFTPVASVSITSDSDFFGKPIDINADSVISFEGIPEDVLYTITVQDINKKNVVSAANGQGNGNSKVAKTETGTYIPVSDKSGNSSVSGGDLETNAGRMTISRIKSSTTGDRMIVSSLDPSMKSNNSDYSKYKYNYEGVFHVNLNNGKFKALDTTQIVLITKSIGGGGSVSMSSDYGIFYTNNYSLKNSKTFGSIINASNSNMDKFNIYMGFGFSPDGAGEPWRIFETVIVNPVDLPFGTTTYTDTDTCFRVNSDGNPSTDAEYVIEVKLPDGCEFNDKLQNFEDNANPRYFDGTRRPIFAPMTDKRGNSASFYVGKIDEDFIFNCCQTVLHEADKVKVEIKLREITDFEKKNIVFVSNGLNHFEITTQTNYKLFVKTDDIPSTSVSFDVGLPDDLEVRYISGHGIGNVGYSGESNPIRSEHKVRPSDSLECFFIRFSTPTDSFPGKVKLNGFEPVGKLSGKVIFLMKNGNALIPKDAQINISYNNGNGSIGFSSSLVKQFDVENNVSFIASNAGNCVVSPQIITSGTDTIVYFVFNHELDNSGVLNVNFDYQQTINIESGNNGFFISKKIRENQYEEIGCLTFTNEKDPAKIYLEPGEYTFCGHSFGYSREDYSLDPTQEDFVINNGEETSMSIISRSEQ